ncbi:MAG: FkbM family methyltransferase [Candidatus Magasanikbacteria bacterium]|nr:FkbM family methyltransferase [Candidatus Magasanikbacteria bacterium]
MKLVSIIIPTYNESKNLPLVVEEIFSIADTKSFDIEIIVVDDNSPDGTGSVADSLKQKFPVKVIHRAGKLGLGSAVREGFKLSGREILGVMDADFSHDPQILNALLRSLETHDIAIGSRFTIGSTVEKWEWWRKILSQAGVIIARAITGVHDPLSGYFFFNRDVIKNTDLTVSGYKILLEILVKGTFSRVHELPYNFRVRKFSTSKLNSKEYYLFLKQIIIYSGYRVKKNMEKGVKKILAIILKFFPISILLFVYKILCKSSFLKKYINNVICAVIPESVKLGDKTLFLNKLDPIVSGSLTFGIYESFETQIFKRMLKPDMVVVDIGANIGYFTLIAAEQVGSQGKVLAFEPENENFALLEKNITYNNLSNVKLFHTALGDSEGTIELFKSEVNKGDHRIYNVENESRERVTVQITKLDTVCKVLDVHTIDIIKIDVQGAEGIVLAGMKNILQESPTLIMFIEFFPLGLRTMGVDPLSFLNELSKTFVLSEIDEHKKEIVLLSDLSELVRRNSGEKYTNLICQKR